MDKRLLDSEWTILKAMWGKEPQTMHEIIEVVQSRQDTGWHYKTYHTYLRTMLEKGLIAYKEKNLRDKLYYAVITREEALKAESETLLSRISASSMGALAAAMVQDTRLSQPDREALAELAERLEQAKEGSRDDG